MDPGIIELLSGALLTFILTLHRSCETNLREASEPLLVMSPVFKVYPPGDIIARVGPWTDFLAHLGSSVVAANVLFKVRQEVERRLMPYNLP